MNLVSLSQLSSELIEADLSTWIYSEMLTQCLADVVWAKRTAWDISLNGTPPNLALHTTRKQSSRCGSTSITVCHILRRHGYAIVFRTLPSDRDAHTLSLFLVQLECGQMNRTRLAVEATICNHLIHRQSLWPLECNETGRFPHELVPLEEISTPWRRRIRRHAGEGGRRGGASPSNRVM
jgi:hypothetical protein